MMSDLKAPFPYFGGKSKIAPLIWSWFGDVQNYVEPFAGSLAVLLSRPSDHTHAKERVNDKDGYISNFWRALAFGAWEDVAKWADWPVNECVPAGTMIATPRGDVPIECIRPGMEVLGEYSGQVVRTRVVATKSDFSNEFCAIGPLLLTGNHPVWTRECGYVEALKLTAGLHIATLSWPVCENDLVMLYCEISVHKGCGTRVGNEQGRGSGGSETGFSLQQRIHAKAPIAVYNLQTGTGNYYANRILVHNCDLHARHYWLVQQREALRARLEGDPAYFDAKIAGWWVWGICSWIGSGFCSGNGPWHSAEMEDGTRQLVHLGNNGQGINRRLVHLGNNGQGINRQRPHLGTCGTGINRQRPQMGNGGTGQGVISKNVDLYDYMAALSDRLRSVDVASGDWSRVCGPSVTYKHGMTGVFLDPPYATEANRADDLYIEDCQQIAHDVRRWCLEDVHDKQTGYKGPRYQHPNMRIALCGYEAEHALHMPNDWEMVAWNAGKGYANQRLNGDNNNGKLERIWFSPNCLKPAPEPVQLGLGI